MSKRTGIMMVPLLMIGSAALAQTVTAPVAPASGAVSVTLVAPVPPAITAPSPDAGAYASLPAGDQKIANSLYQAEHRSPLTGLKPMSRDDIAAAKLSGDGWGVVFKQMQHDGLVSAKNLGQVVSGHALAHAHLDAPLHAAPVTVTLGNGRTEVASAGGREFGGAAGAAAGGHAGIETGKGTGHAGVTTAGGHGAGAGIGGAGSVSHAGGASGSHAGGVGHTH